MIKFCYHICNPLTPEQIGVKNIYSQAELSVIKEEVNSVYLINIHLNWDEQKLSNNYGFDIARELRTKIKSKAPIIFYSPLQLEYFEYNSKYEIKYKLLFGRGSKFLEAPFTKEALNMHVEEIEPLNEAVLHDVVTMLCDLKGVVVEKINHDLKFGKDIDEVINSIVPYFSEEQRKMVALDAFVSEIKQLDKEKDFNTARQLFVEKCNIELASNDDNIPRHKRIKYNILIIDDVPEELEKAANYLKDDFEVITASTGKMAIDILLADTNNKIVTVVSDWRLFTDENKNYWQPLQGYEVLEIAAKTGVRALFALTSQANFLIHQIRNLMGVHFPVFQKQNLITEGQWKVMADALLEASEMVDEIIKNQPTSTQWKSRMRKGKDCGISLQEIYAAKRSTKEGFFADIKDRADEIWQAYADKKKVRYLLGELSTTLINDDVLKEVLIQRRIWIGLFLNCVSAEDIYEVMSKDPHKSPSKDDITQLKIKLCIVENDIKHRRFLPEEKAWFKKWNLID